MLRVELKLLQSWHKRGLRGIHRSRVWNAIPATIWWVIWRE
ncbi:hypothetical protein MTR67_023849 [Solanum verrucosum]|uniref:Uncharacterized protein n=1 Tax=Solanum verrucosum TaxID=315347 RepID=A0AAF0QUA5_SOLVR|nr:hypothetical protein MTR67_023849 [Solanum verrucosum]